MTLTTTRRTLLAGAAASVAGPAAAQQATTLKLYTYGYDIEAAALASEVPNRTEGRYRIETISGFDMLEAALGKERVAAGDWVLVEGVQKGELDLSVTAAAPVAKYVPGMEIFDVPFLFRDYAHAWAVLDGPIGRDILARFPAHGLAGLAWTEQGFRQLMNSKRPVRTPEDLKGLKLRTQDIAIIIEGFQTLGAEVMTKPWGRELFDALAQGIFDGMEIDLDSIVAFEIFRWQKYLSVTDHIYSPAVTIMAMPVYDKLSDADKQAFIEAAWVGTQVNRKDRDDADPARLVQLLEAGMRISTDVDKAAFRAALAPAYAGWRQQFGGLIDRIQAYE